MWRGCSDFGAICVMITEVLARRHCGRRGSINHRYGQCIIGVWPGRGEQGGISDITAFIQTEYHMCSGLGVPICVGSKWKRQASEHFVPALSSASVPWRCCHFLGVSVSSSLEALLILAASVIKELRLWTLDVTAWIVQVWFCREIKTTVTFFKGIYQQIYTRRKL